MTRRFAILLVFFSILVALPAMAFERYYVVKHSKPDKSETYVVLDKEGLKALKDEVKERGKYMSRAISAAKKKWRAAPDQYEGSFPTLGREVVQEKGSYKTQAEASARATKYIDREVEAKKEAKASIEDKANEKFRLVGQTTSQQRRKNDEKRLEWIEKKLAEDHGPAQAYQMVLAEITELQKPASK